jgi:hypothetical protein
MTGEGGLKKSSRSTLSRDIAEIRKGKTLKPQRTRRNTKGKPEPYHEAPSRIARVRI